MKIAKILKSTFAVAIVLALCLSMIPAVSAADTWQEVALANIQPTDRIAITMTNSTNTYVLLNNGGTQTYGPLEVFSASTVKDTMCWNVVAVSGGYKIQVAGDSSKWLYTTNANNGLRVGTTEAGSTFKLDSATGYLSVTDSGSNVRYIGVYNDQNFRGYKLNSGNIADNIKDQTLKFYKASGSGSTTPTTKPTTAPTTAPAASQYEVATAPVVGTAYKLGLAQNNVSKTLYFNGQMSGYYLGTTEKAEEAVDVFMETVSGGVHLYFMDGTTKTYIEIYERDDNGTTKPSQRTSTTAPASVFVWDASVKTFTSTFGENVYYLGTYNTFTTISASKISYITGENAANVGVSQFPVQMYAKKAGGTTQPTTKPTTAPTTAPAVTKYEVAATPAVGTGYKLGLAQNNEAVNKTLYFNGQMSGYYLGTTDKAEEAVDVFMEEVSGGVHLYFMDGTTKTYIEIYERDDNGTMKPSQRTSTTAPASVFVWDRTLKTFTSTFGENVYYLGTYNTYTTISASKISYITGDNAANVGVSQFPAQMYTKVTSGSGSTPNLGDNTNIAGMTAVMVLAATCLFALVIGSKKRKV
ncbi:MAG: hypothetical protein E7462_04280 [Ruminococcaceae bacterium]|nr:hypothetical protein [Oscillospiraceae bacterium]